MKKWIALILCLLIPVCGALADQQITLPGDHYSLTLPDGMQYSPQNKTDKEVSPYFQYAYFSGTLEMDVFQYASGGVTLKKLAGSMKEKVSGVAESLAPWQVSMTLFLPADSFSIATETLPLS